MTGDKFRKLALELPEVVEQSHMGHPDFRVGGKIFATLDGEEKIGMVNLTSDFQAMVTRSESEIYYPANGAWGQNGCAMLNLRKARVAPIRAALLVAWHKTAPKTLAINGPQLP